jgi:hypothetical protein
MRYGKRRKREMGLLPPLELKQIKQKVDLNGPGYCNQDFSKFNDLRFRPFLVIEAYARPADHARTERANWQLTPYNMRHHEVPSVVDRVNLRIMRRAEVIIDLMKDTVIKNRMEAEEDVDQETFNGQILEHLKRKYSSMIQKGKDAWKARA